MYRHIKEIVNRSLSSMALRWCSVVLRFCGREISLQQNVYYPDDNLKINMSKLYSFLIHKIK